MTRPTYGDQSEIENRIGEVVERYLAEAIAGAGCLDRYGTPKTEEQLRHRALVAQRAARRLLRRR